jgi:hypothetical protein
MARSKNRSSAHTCPRCAALLTLGASHCGLCQFDLMAPVAPVAPVMELVPAPAVVESVADSVLEPMADSVLEPALQITPDPVLALVVEPADQEYTSTSVFLPLPHDLPAAPVAITDEPTPLAPVELLAEARSVDFALFNPRDPFSWYPVIQA